MREDKVFIEHVEYGVSTHLVADLWHAHHAGVSANELKLPSRFLMHSAGDLFQLDVRNVSPQHAGFLLEILEDGLAHRLLLSAR